MLHLSFQNDNFFYFYFLFIGTKMTQLQLVIDLL